MIVVFDTNIWFTELGLRSPSGAAARFFLRQKQARLALPEVVRLEVERNLRNRLREFTANIQRDHRQLLTAFGSLKELILPSDDDIEKKVADIFANVDVSLLEIPFSLQSARNSLIRTIDKVAPSHGKQQFKDGVLWADCVALLEGDDVFLVTNDTDFYQDSKYEKGLAEALAKEIAGAQHKFTLLPTLSALLKELRTDIAIDEQLLAKAFLEQNQESIFGVLSRNGFDLGRLRQLERTLYVTENPTRLFIEFSMTYECLDISGGNRQSAVLELKGDGTYDTGTGRFEQLRNFGEELRFDLDDGSEKQVRNVVLFAAGMVIGHREISHTVRYKLD